MSFGVTLLARTESADGGAPGYTTLVVEKDTPGFTMEPKIRGIGSPSLGTRELSYDDVWVADDHLVGDPAMGLGQFLGTLEVGRISIAALSLSLTMVMVLLYLLRSAYCFTGAGDGESHASATSSGEGTSGAHAFATGGGAYAQGPLPAGRAGDARATSDATSRGGGSAVSEAWAAAGYSFTEGGGPAQGGDATAEATAGVNGTGLAQAMATATFVIDNFGVASGRGTATATASGGGEILSLAQVVGEPGSRAHSIALPSGSVLRHDVALEAYGPQDEFQEAFVTEADARIGYSLSRAEYLAGGPGGYAVVNAIPVEEEVAQVTADNPIVAQGLTGASELLALGFLGGSDGESSVMSLSLGEDVFLGGKPLELGFVDTLVPATGFARLELELARRGDARGPDLHGCRRGARRAPRRAVPLPARPDGLRSIDPGAAHAARSRRIVRPGGIPDELRPVHGRGAPARRPGPAARRARGDGTPERN